MISSLNSILQTNIKIKVVDIGANPVDGKPNYYPLLERGDAHVVGFEPEPEALAKLNADQAAKDAAAKPVPPVAVTPSPKP